MRARASEGRVPFFVNTHPLRTRMQRTFGVFLVALACTGVGAAGAQAAQPFKPQLPALQRGNDGIARAFAAGRISEAQYALERVRAIAEPVRARLIYGDVETPERYDATIIFRDLVARLDRLSTSERAVAQRLLARPTSAFDSIRRYRTQARNRCGPRICVFWVEKTSDAPSLKDKNGNNVPDWIDLTRKVTNYVWSVEVGRMGYRAPKSDRGSKNHGQREARRLRRRRRRDRALRLLHHRRPDPRAARRHLRLLRGRRRLRALQFNGAAYGGNALRVTVAHEFFHAVQYGYDYLEDLAHGRARPGGWRTRSTTR